MDATTRYARVRRTDGMSLMETVGTMALLAVVSAIAVSGFKNLGDQYRLVSAANQVAYDISWARMQAIGQHASMRLRLIVHNQVNQLDLQTNARNFIAAPTTASNSIGFCPARRTSRANRF